MATQKQFWPALILVVLVLAIVAVLLVGVLTRSVTPSWVLDGGTFLKYVGKALTAYARDHNGDLPRSLGALYPDYIQDKRARESVAVFGSRQMVIMYYYQPTGMRDSRTRVAAVRLAGSSGDHYDWCGLMLWGDGRVSLIPEAKPKPRLIRPFGTSVMMRR